MADAGAMSSVWRLMSVASCRGRFVFLRIAHRVSRRWRFAPFFRLVSRSVSCLVLVPSRFVLIAIRGGEAGSVWRDVGVIG